MRLPFLISLLLISAVLVACSEGAQEDTSVAKSVIIGSWTVTAGASDNAERHYQYLEDGTGIYEDEYGITLFEYQFIDDDTILTVSEDLTLRANIYVADENTIFQENATKGYEGYFEKLVRVSSE